MVRRVSRQVDAAIKRCLCNHNYQSFIDYYRTRWQFAAQVNNKGRVFTEKLRSFFSPKRKHPLMHVFDEWISNQNALPRGCFLLRYYYTWADYIRERRMGCAACSRLVPPPPPFIHAKETDDEDEDNKDKDRSSSSSSIRDNNSDEEAMKFSPDDYSHASNKSLSQSNDGGSDNSGSSS